METETTAPQNGDNRIETPCKQNICCAIITHHPNRQFPECAAKIAPQVDRLLIVDNDSGESVTSLLKSAASNLGADLILNEENLGQAAALNQAVRWARDLGYRWLLTLDQDTVPYGFMVEGLIKAYPDLDDQREVAVIGSNYLDTNTGSPLLADDKSDSSAWVETAAVITSGSLISLAANDVVGPFREEFFIDQVDYEYCLRARSKGYLVALARRPLMEHKVGSPTKVRLLWKRLSTTNAPPARRYYQTRNHLIIVREYLFKERAWVRHSLEVRLKEMVLMLLFENERLAKAGAVVRGIADAMLGKMGRLPG